MASRRGGGVTNAGNASKVQSLVRSVNQHKKFKQLTMYLLNSLEKVLRPPHSGWEANAAAAFACGAAEAVSAVLALHKVCISLYCLFEIEGRCGERLSLASTNGE